MRLFSLLILCYLLLILQLSFVPELTVAGYRPNLILVMVCLALFWYRDATVFLWGILAGLIYETFDAAIPGTAILLLTGLIWIAFRIQVHFQIRSLLSRFVLMLVLAFFFDAMFSSLNRLELTTLPNLISLAQYAAGNAVFTAATGLGLLLVFKIVQRLLPVDMGSHQKQDAIYESRFSH